MREIKFRAWDGNKMLTEKDIVEDRINVDFLTLSGIYVRNGKVSGFKILQYTGLKDKNGKEIYEGDIVKCKSIKGSIYWFKDGVCFRYGMKGVDTQYDKGHSIIAGSWLEVIGNIYENPELLKEVNNEQVSS